jgi:hypothetical protein
MQIAYVLAGVVTRVLTGLSNDVVIPSATPGEIAVPVHDNLQVAAGWAATQTGGVYRFSVPTAFPTLAPMDFYLAFTPAERIAIKKSIDPVIVEFWTTFELQVQLGGRVDPNLVSVQEGLNYLATPTTATPPGAGILASQDRIAQINAGIAQ